MCLSIQFSLFFFALLCGAYGLHFMINASECLLIHELFFLSRFLRAFHVFLLPWPFGDYIWCFCLPYPIKYYQTHFYSAAQWTNWNEKSINQQIFQLINFRSDMRIAYNAFTHFSSIQSALHLAIQLVESSMLFYALLCLFDWIGFYVRHSTASNEKKTNIWSNSFITSNGM